MYKAAVIGCGEAGAFYDQPSDGHILTHAHAYFAHNAYELKALVDQDYKKAQKAAEVWGGKAYRSAREAILAEGIDVVSVCVPTPQHYDLLMEIKGAPLKGVLAEKPLADDLDKARQLVDVYRGIPIGVLVNYKRRYVPAFQKIKDEIHAGDYGAYVSGHAYYGKGILNNGSHILDLLRFFFDDINSWLITSSRVDFVDSDPTLSAILKLDNDGSFHLIGIDHNLYAVMEMDLFFEKKRIRIFDKGYMVEEYHVERDKHIPRLYTSLNRKSIYDTEASCGLYDVLENMYECIKYNKPPLCNIEDALTVQEICHQMIEDSSLIK